MAANSGRGRNGASFGLNVRQIVIAGILGGIVALLGYTRWGFIPVPNLAGSATILQVPAILGGAIEGPVVGLIVGLLFGIFSWLDPIVPFFRDPLVSILPRLFIGVAAWAVFAALRRWNLTLASAAAGVIGSLTNTVGVLTMLVVLKYLPPAAIIPIIPQAIVEAILSAVITVIVVRGVMLYRSGRTTAPEAKPDEERRY